MKRVVIGVSLGIAVVAAIAVFAGGHAEALRDREQLAALVERAGALGPVLFVALIVALFPVFLIGPPVWASLALWPAPLAIFYSSMGCLAASLLFYALARSLGREWAQPRIPDGIRKYEDALVERPLRTIVVMRLLIWANPAVDLLIGVSRVRPRDYLLATAVGLLPATAAQVLVVGQGIGLALELPGEVWITIAAIVASMLALRRLRSRRVGSAEVAQPAPERE